MLKKIYIAILFTLFSSNIFAYNVDDAPPSLPFYIGAAVGSDGHGIPLNAFIGNGKTYTQSISYYLGWEAGAYTIAESKGRGTSYGAGISFLPGIKFTPNTLGYLRVGLLAGDSNSPQKSHFGDQFGLGIQTKISSNWDIRGEYICREYNNASHTEGSNAYDTNEIDLGFVYNFK